MTERDTDGCRFYAGDRALQATRRFYLATTQEEKARSAKWVIAWARRGKFGTGKVAINKAQ
jgi:predicted DNA-binding WGR domain protein